MSEINRNEADAVLDQQELEKVSGGNTLEDAVRIVSKIVSNPLKDRIFTHKPNHDPQKPSPAGTKASGEGNR